MEESLMSLTLAEIMAKMPQAFVAEKAGDMNAIVHFKFTGAEAGEWNATIRDGACQVAQGIPRSRPTITVAADSDDYRRMVTGELDPARAFMEGRLKLTGNKELALKLVSIFRIP
jgi:putative sterol carrier protein